MSKLQIIQPHSLPEIPTLANVLPGQDEHQIRVAFDNGYVASVINDGYGSHNGEFEIAVLDIDGQICKDTPITQHVDDDVLGFLSAAEAADILRQIAELPLRSTALAALA